jgi:hypothetical protein
MRNVGQGRAIGTLLVMAVALGVFTLAPVTAHFTQSTEHLGNHAWQQVIKRKTDRLYVRKCRSGSALAWAYVATSDLSTTDFSTAGVSPQYNCAGGRIRVLKVTPTAGTYQVRIPGIKASMGGGERLIASVTATNHLARMMSQDVHTTDDYIEVDAFDPAGTKADTDFVIVVFRRP